MDGFRLVVPVTVRFRDCDALGHVNNAVYFTYLEEARFRWFREVFGATGFEKHSIILAEAKCSFRAAATHGEILDVGIRVERIGKSSFSHRYRIEAAEPTPPGGKHTWRLIAEAESVGVGFDYATKSSRELAPDFRAAIEKHQGPLAL